MTFNEYVNILKRKIFLVKQNIVIIGIGNSEFLWDSIGPKVGSYLIQANEKLIVLGNEKCNICENRDLQKYTSKLNEKFVIAIDSAKGNKDEIFISNSPIQMGSAFNNIKGEIGNLGIKASFTDLENINSYQVNKTVRFIAEGILRIL